MNERQIKLPNTLPWHAVPEFLHEGSRVAGRNPAIVGRGDVNIARVTRLTFGKLRCKHAEFHAQFIERACNSHQQLLEACELFLARYENNMVNADLMFSDVAEAARAAVRTATEGTEP